MLRSSRGWTRSRRGTEFSTAMCRGLVSHGLTGKLPGVGSDGWAGAIPPEQMGTNCCAWLVGQVFRGVMIMFWIVRSLGAATGSFLVYPTKLGCIFAKLPSRRLWNCLPQSHCKGHHHAMLAYHGACFCLIDTWHLKSFCFTTSIWWLRWFFVLTRKSPVFFLFLSNPEELSGDAQAHAVSWKNGGPQSWKMDTKACDSVIVMSKNSWWIIKTNLWCGGNVVINGWKIHRDCRLQEPLCCQSLCHYCSLVVNWYSFLNSCLA